MEQIPLSGFPLMKIVNHELMWMLLYDSSRGGYYEFWMQNIS